MSGYTKGPWEVNHRDGSLHLDTPEDGCIMCDETYYPWAPEKVEDWYLISAAPGLLEALKKSESLLRRLMGAVGGNDKLPGCEEFYRGYNAVTSRVAGQANEIFVEVNAAIAKAEGK